MNPTKSVLRKGKQFNSNSGIRRVTLVKSPVVSHETEKDENVITHVTYPSSYIELSNILLKSTFLFSELFQII